MKKILLIMALAFTAVCAKAADTDSLKVLWIGNSYTYVNNLPEKVQKIAASCGVKLSMTRRIVGGQTLKGHYETKNVIEALKKGGWDYVMIQECSYLPSYSTASVAKDVYPYAKKLDSIAMKYSKKAHVVFYMTWGHKYGQLEQTPYPLDDTYEGMQMRLATSYLEMAYDNDAWCAPVGLAWKKTRELHPDYVLYNPDCSHPSLAGTYLAANVFFTVIYQKQFQTGETFGLPAAEAETLQQIAQSTVLGNLKLLNIAK